MPTPFNIRKNIAKLLNRLFQKKDYQRFDIAESEMSSGHESRDRPSALIMKKPSFDMSIPAENGNSAEDRIKGLGIMFMFFCHENIIEYLCHLLPEGATGSELEQFLKSRAREADPDKETFAIANMFIKDFWTYYPQVIQRLCKAGFIYAGDEEKFFANPTLPKALEDK